MVIVLFALLPFCFILVISVFLLQIFAEFVQFVGQVGEVFFHFQLLQKGQVAVEQVLHRLVVFLDVLQHLLHLLARHLRKEFVDLFHEFLQLLGNHLVEELVDLFLLLDEVFVAQVVFLHEVRQLVLFFLQFVPFFLNLLLPFHQVFHLFLVGPVQIQLLDKVLQHLFYLVLQFIGLLRFLGKAVHDVFRRLVGDTVQSSLGRLVISEGLGAL